MLTAGIRLSGRYVVEKPLGQGGMAAVYLARVEALGNKPVAIKEMFIPETSPENQQRAIAQFQQEASFLANLSHPNLVPVTDFFEEGGKYYLVMGYVKGTTLAEQLHSRGAAFPVAQVLDWAGQLCSVLDYLHTQNPPILFRDLKPSNIMLDEQGTIRLIDFGIARAFDPGDQTATFLQGVGSAGYSPIEQYQGAGSTDPRSDIYSLGATLYHLLTNQIPKSPVELISDGSKLVPPRDLNPAIPLKLQGVLVKMMGLRKEQRYLKMSDASSALSEVTKELSGPEQMTENLGPSTEQFTATAVHPALAASLTAKPSTLQDFQVPASTAPMDEPPRVPAGLIWAMVCVAAVFLTIGLMNGPTTRAQPQETPAVVTTDTREEVVAPASVLKSTKVAEREPSRPTPDYIPAETARPQPSSRPQPTAVRQPEPTFVPEPVEETEPKRTSRSKPAVSSYPRASSYPKASRQPKTEPSPEKPPEPARVAAKPAQPEPPAEQPAPPPPRHGHPPFPPPGFPPPPPGGGHPPPHPGGFGGPPGIPGYNTGR
ncbi:MAG: serine/threonine protein kinase [Vulcanimicrobiota bacterium]